MKRIIMTAATILFAGMFIFSGVMLCRLLLEQKQNADAFADVAGLVREDPSRETAEGDSTPGSDTPGQPSFMSAYEKYAGVYAQNNDFAGWISIEGTKLDYPVMQTPDTPDFYLKHAFDRSNSRYGVPFIQANCDIELSDNLVIYGHNMKDGSMFATLCKYEDEAFYREHKIIHFDTLSGFGEYEIVAVFKTVARENEGFAFYQFTDAEDQEDFDEYIASCKKLALYDTEVSAVYGDRLITLSTCEYSHTDGRLVVVAKLAKDETDTE